MKKLLAAAVLFCTIAAPAIAADSSFIKLSLWDDISVPNVQTVKGIDLGLGRTTTADVTGVQWNLIWTRNNTMTGWQWGIFGESDDFTGLQTHLVALSGNVTGIQWGAVNVAQNHISGAQLGFFNYAESMKGLQLGFVNYAKYIDKGVQIGLVNFAENGFLPVMILVNGRF